MDAIKKLEVGLQSRLNAIASFQHSKKSEAFDDQASWSADAGTALNDNKQLTDNMLVDLKNYMANETNSASAELDGIVADIVGNTDDQDGILENLYELHQYIYASKDEIDAKIAKTSSDLGSKRENLRSDYGDDADYITGFGENINAAPAVDYNMAV